MEEMSSKFSTAFRSNRLIYRAIDDTDADRELISITLNDPVSQGLGDPNLYYPINNTTAKNNMGQAVANSLIAVLICLPHQEDKAFLATLNDPDNNSPYSIPGTRLKQAQARALPIGSMCLFKQSRVSTQHLRFARIGLGIQEEYQKKGYGEEAINWLIDWGFEYAGLHRIELGTASYNERALRLYERIGFKKEGVRRECVFMARKWWDMIDYGMLEGEWEQLRGKSARGGGV